MESSTLLPFRACTGCCGSTKEKHLIQGGNGSDSFIGTTSRLKRYQNLDLKDDQELIIWGW